MSKPSRLAATILLTLFLVWLLFIGLRRQPVNGAWTNPGSSDITDIHAASQL